MEDIWDFSVRANSLETRAPLQCHCRVQNVNAWPCPHDLSRDLLPRLRWVFQARVVSGILCMVGLRGLEAKPGSNARTVETSVGSK